MRTTHKWTLTLALAATAVTGCKKEFSNPNDATLDQTLSSPVGLTGVAVGIVLVNRKPGAA